ncbi:hypothetical protein [Nocardia terpenica]|uniref:Uncharacterized protein n=1 Tax=Nocardia terpenica TaxID=455432 RepID=A0A164JI57_9NOCA|nr:hypothetical protein [Nocardia terpenica]KZM70426.1 hypothetical protein AWN90_03865 [Nocardia terpenica]NQE91108.1 hypothetical protein [Nocardia terpenica]
MAAVMARSGPIAVRGGDIPVEQAAVLREVQRLAAEEARLHAASQAPGDFRRSVQLVGEISAAGRARSIAEMTAEVAGVPRGWIGRVRRLGQAGRLWDDGQLLPVPPPHPRRRRTAERVEQDAAQLMRLVAVTVVREHRLSVDGSVGDSDPQLAPRMRRVMDLLWARAGLTAYAIGMTPQERDRLWSIDDRGWCDQVNGFLHFPGDELDEIGRIHATDDHVAVLRESVRRLRTATGVGGDPAVSSTVTDRLPAPPGQMLTRARAAAHTLLAQHRHYEATSAAIAAALPGTDTPTNTGPGDPDPGIGPGVAPGTETGPDP